jgi:hypothetical protein
MNMQSKTVLAITFVVVIFSQVQAQEQHRDRPRPPAFSSIDINGDGEIYMDEFSQQPLPNTNLTNYLIIFTG